jgi:hypothetical protein
MLPRGETIFKETPYKGSFRHLDFTFTFSRHDETMSYDSFLHQKSILPANKNNEKCNKKMSKRFI